jgi:anti-sigma regulatory factor (Ser/Thr protein kinase)
MTSYEIINTTSGHSFGVYEGATEQEAIEACVRDAGYKSTEDMQQQLGQPCELVATVHVDA